MYRLVFILSLFSSCYVGANIPPRNPNIEDRIIGGSSDDVEISDYPYQLSLEYYGSHYCGASIIDENWALTAAHCIDGIAVSNVALRAGSSIRGSGGSLHKVSQLLVNPNYDYYTIDFDIAIIQVSNVFVYGPEIQPIPLISTEPAAGEKGVITGWGSPSSGGSLPIQLQAMFVTIVDRNICSQVYMPYGGITKNMICIDEDQEGTDYCFVEGGAPLSVGGKLAGLASWSMSCDLQRQPFVYTSIASMKSWITGSTGIN